MDQTPLEKARQRETEYCREMVFVNGAFYCEKSGKLLHPMCITENGHCRNKPSCAYLDNEWSGDKLRPCPFCGGQAEVEKENLYPDVVYKARCASCFASTTDFFADHPRLQTNPSGGLDESTRYTEEQAKADAIEAWNMRAADVAPLHRRDKKSSSEGIPPWDRMEDGNTSIRELHLSPRAQNALLRGGIYTIEKLMTLDPEEIGKVRYVGKVSLQEIVEAILKYEEEKYDTNS